jgi:ComF family protein
MAARIILDTLLKLLFPDRCAGCRQLGGLFCRACQAALTAYPGGDRRASPASLNSAHIAFVFQSPVREAIHQLKYRRVQRMAQPLGELLAAHLSAQSLHIDAVLATPLHATRLAERGFNQAEELAQVVAQSLRRPLIRNQLLRTRPTEQQAHLDAQARAENMRDAFRWRGAPPPRQVLIVDDVYTTGATMGACADAVRAAGAEVVHGAALARSRLEPRV